MDQDRIANETRAVFDRVVGEALTDGDPNRGLTLMLLAVSRDDARGVLDPAVDDLTRRYGRGIDVAVAIDDHTIALGMPNCSLAGALAAGEAMRNDVRGAFDLAIGVATRRPGDTIETLLARARIALDAALDQPDGRIVADAAASDIDMRGAADSGDTASKIADIVFSVDVETLLRIPNQP